MKRFGLMLLIVLMCSGCSVTTGDKEPEALPLVSAGWGHAVAVTTSGDLYAWGDNYNGQVGDGTTTTQYTPVKVMSDVKTAVAGNNYTLAVKNDGTLWAWGCNAFGSFGNGTKSQTCETPVQITDNVEKVCVGDYTSFIIKTDKTLWGCGYNSGFKLGSGNGSLQEQELSFVKILDDVADVFIPDQRSVGFALKTDGTLYAWGEDHALESLDPPATPPADERQWFDYSEYYPIRVDTDIAECELVGDVLYCSKKDGSYTYYAQETFDRYTFYVNQSRYESENARLPHPSESITLSNGWSYTLYTEPETNTLYADGVICAGIDSEIVVCEHSNKLLFEDFYYAEFYDDGMSSAGVFVITRDGTLWAWGGNYTGIVGAGTDDIYGEPTEIMNLGAA